MAEIKAIEHGEEFSSYRWFALFVVMVGTFMVILDNSIVNVALPHMMASFGTNVDRIKWVVTIYMVSFAISTLLSHWLRQLFGLKVLFILSMGLFTFSSALCGMAWNTDTLVIFRAIQGIGGGIMFPTGTTMITEIFPPRERGKAFGVYGIVIVFAPTIGPTLGGYLVDYVNWRYIFYVNVPVGLLGMIAAGTILQWDKRAFKLPSFDLWGFLGLSSCLIGLLLALSNGQREGWNSDYILQCFGISILGLLIFIIVDLNVKYPIFHLELFRNVNYSIICLLNLSRAVGLFGRIFLLPLFLQRLMGYSAMRTGFLLAPGALIAGMTAPIIGRFSDRFGPKGFIVAGFVLLGSSQYLFHNLSPDSNYWYIFWPQIIFGVALGNLTAPLASTAMNIVRKDQIGMVSITISVLFQIGGSFGVAFIGTLLDRRQAFHYAMFSEQTGQSPHAYKGALLDLQHLLMRGGDSANLAMIKAKGLLIALVNKQATVQSFNDAFILLSVLCAFTVIPAFLLRHLKFQTGH
jgi:DHA2 family multidrug resistance protein